MHGDEGVARKRRPHRRRRVILIALASVLTLSLIGGGVTLYVLGADNPALFEGKVSEVESRFADGYPQGEIILTGSSFFERWSSSDEDLAPLDTINVGIGSTKIGDQAAYVDRLVTPFHPRAVVVYAGSNDISGLPFFTKQGDDVAARVISYLDDLHQTLPEARLYYVAITEAPIRVGVRAQIQLANGLLAEYAKSTDFLTFIDTSPELLTPEGEIDATLFGSDNLHFNTLGYEKFSQAIRPILIEDLR